VREVGTGRCLRERRKLTVVVSRRLQPCNSTTIGVSPTPPRAVLPHALHEQVGDPARVEEVWGRPLRAAMEEAGLAQVVGRRTGRITLVERNGRAGAVVAEGSAAVPSRKTNACWPGRAWHCAAA
jgi:hypothetical protein